MVNFVSQLQLQYWKNVAWHLQICNRCFYQVSELWPMGPLFNLQVTLMLPTEFQVNWPFGSGEEGKNRFSRYDGHLGFRISNPNDFSYF